MLPLHVFAICLRQKLMKARCLHNSGLSKKLRMWMWLRTMGLAWFCDHDLVHISGKLRIIAYYLGVGPPGERCILAKPHILSSNQSGPGFKMAYELYNQKS